MKKLLAILIIFFSVNAYATDLEPGDSKLIEAAGIPLYPKAVFINWDQDTGYRFATSVPPEEARAWYRKQLPKWALYNENGGWELYDGAPAIGFAQVLSGTYVLVQKNEFLPQWFSLEKNMTTEIVIRIAE